MATQLSARRSPRRSARTGGLSTATLWGLPAITLLMFALLTLFAYRALALPMTARLDRTRSPADPPDQGRALAPFFSPSVHRWQPLIERSADDSGLPSALIATVMQIESCGDPAARSSAGALGLMQVMPYHFNLSHDPLDPTVNLAVGVNYLRGAFHKAEGDITRTLAGYNGGHAVIDRNQADWPAETQRYVMWGTGIYADATQGAATSLTLDRWLAAGGQSLCRTAEARLAAR